MGTTATLNQYIAGLLVSSSGLAIGVTFGWSSLVGYTLRSTIGWEPGDADIVIGILGAGAGIGALGVPLVLACLEFIYKDLSSASGGLAYAAVPLLVIGWFIVFLANYSFKVLIIGRFLSGAGIGLLSVLVPLYIAEMAGSEKRDRLLFYFHMMLSSGIFCSYLIAYTYFSDYDDRDEELPLKRYSLGCALACLPSMLCCMAPASPLARAVRGDETDAVEAMGRWVMGPMHRLNRGDETVQQRRQEQLELEIEHMRMLVQVLAEPKNKWQLAKNKRFCRNFLVVSCIMGCQQLSGASSIIFNILTLFDFMGSGHISKNHLSLICSACQIGASVIATATILRLGRRILLVVSTALMGFFLIVLGVYMSKRDENPELDETYFWLPPTCISLFLASYSLGLGPVSWSLLADSFPIEIRVPVASVIASAGWFMCLILNGQLLTMLIDLGPGALLLFTGFCWIAGIVGFIFLEETRGKSLADIQEEFEIR